MKRGWAGWPRSPLGWLVAGGALLGCSLAWASGAGAAVRKEQGDRAAWLTNRFSITGMHCKDCAKGLTAELKLTPGVVRAVVSFTETLATVVYDSKRVESSSLLKTIQEAGFRGTLITNAPTIGSAVKTGAGSAPATKASPEPGSP